MAPSFPPPKYQPRYQIIATRGQIMGQAGTDGGGTPNNYVRSESRFRFRTAPVDVYDVRALYLNAGISIAPGGDYWNDDVDIEAALDLQSPFFYLPLTFGGQRTALLQGGGSLLSDSNGYDFPAGTDLWVRTGLTVSAPGKMWVRGVQKSVVGESCYESSSATSQIYGNGPLTLPSGGAEADNILTNGAGYTAYALIGKPSHPCPAVLISGDSIADGVAEPSSGDGNGNYGHIARGLWNAARGPIPYSKCTRGQDSPVGGVIKIAGRRRAVWPYATHVVCHNGGNGLRAQSIDASISQIQAYWASFRRFGLKIAQGTIEPQSTDATNTVPASGWEAGGVRDQFNAYLPTALANGLIDWIIDGAAAVEDPNRHGLWINGTTDSGLHPNATGYALMSVPVTAWANRL